MPNYQHLLLLSNILNCSINEILIGQKTLTKEQQFLFDQQKERLDQGYPLDYLIGKIKIGSLEFLVDENVLIPREETEFWLQKLSLMLEGENISLLIDVGCGCGLIGLSLHRFAKKVILSDISDQAMEIAKKNAKLNKIENVEFILSNLLQNLGSKITNSNWALVANLPYLPSSDKELAIINKVQFEPDLALYSGSQGLDLFKKLLQQLHNLDKKMPKQVYFELDPRNIKTAQILLEKLYPKTEIWSDENGLERVLAAKL